MSVRDDLGDVIGRLWSGPVAAISAARKARMFHPRGIALAARVEGTGSGPLAELGRRLAGPALARFSGALFKADVQRFEVLGLALRFSDAPVVEATPRERDQDVLLATIVSPFSMPLSPFTTRSDDYLANHYWAVSPFEVGGPARVKLRVSPASPAPPRTAGTRDDKLVEALGAGRGVLVLEARRTLRIGWEAVARVHLEAVSTIDQEALRFDPFRSGRAIVPAGLVHHIRRDVYPASQDARPKSSR